MTIAEVAQRVRRKELSPVEIMQECLRRIEELNPRLNAFITVMAESALEEARAAEEEISRGHWRGPLHGIPVALKDLIDTAGVRTTSASACGVGKTQSNIGLRIGPCAQNITKL